VESALVNERQALLGLELAALGVNVRRLEFIRWLIANNQDPEWLGRRPDSRKAVRREVASGL